MFRKKKKENPIDIDKLLSEMDTVSLIRLKERLDKEFSLREPASVLEGSKTLKMKDYNCNRHRDISFIIDSRNTILGVDNFSSLYVGKLDEDLSVILIELDPETPFPTCFEGAFDIQNRVLVGGWYSEHSIGKMLTTMREWNHEDSKLRYIPNDKLEYIDLLVEDRYEKVKNSGWLSSNYKELVSEIKAMTGSKTNNPVQKRISNK